MEGHHKHYARAEENLVHYGQQALAKEASACPIRDQVGAGPVARASSIMSTG
jgi:hypothetical protein